MEKYQQTSNEYENKLSFLNQIQSDFSYQENIQQKNQNNPFEKNTFLNQELQKNIHLMCLPYVRSNRNYHNYFQIKNQDMISLLSQQIESNPNPNVKTVEEIENSYKFKLQQQWKNLFENKCLPNLNYKYSDLVHKQSKDNQNRYSLSQQKGISYTFYIKKFISQIVYILKLLS